MCFRPVFAIVQPDAQHHRAETYSSHLLVAVFGPERVAWLADRAWLRFRPAA
jgi:hypothetical protein